MKLRRTLAIVGITVMIAGGLTAVAGGAASAASSAAAAGDSQLCIDPANESPFCALDPTDVGATSQYGVFMSEALGSDWVYPTKPFNNTYSNNSSNTNYIVEAATDSCLQIDEADSWVVRLAPCIGDQAESWENWYNATTRRTEFVSTYFSGDDFFLPVPVI